MISFTRVQPFLNLIPMGFIILSLWVVGTWILLFPSELFKALCYTSRSVLVEYNLPAFKMLTTVLAKFYREYTNNTSKKLKIIDCYLLYVFLTGIFQFVYCCLVGTFPFNSFLSGFISSVSCFVLAVCLRLQVNPQNKIHFGKISPERGFADFIIAHIILHLVVVNFIG